MKTAEQLRTKATAVRKAQDTEAKAQARKVQAARRKASAAAVGPLVERCLREAAEAAAQGETQDKVYAHGEAAFDAADRVAEQLRAQGFTVTGGTSGRCGYTIFAGMDSEGYGGETSHHAVWYISWGKK